MNKGFAIIMRNDKILTDPAQIAVNDQLQAILKNEVLHTIVNKKETNANKIDF